MIECVINEASLFVARVREHERGRGEADGLSLPYAATLYLAEALNSIHFSAIVLHDRPEGDCTFGLDPSSGELVGAIWYPGEDPRPVPELAQTLGACLQQYLGGCSENK